MESSLFFLVAVIAGGLFLLWMILYFIPIGLWFQALVSDVKISLPSGRETMQLRVFSSV